MITIKSQREIDAMTITFKVGFSAPATADNGMHIINNTIDKISFITVLICFYFMFRIDFFIVLFRLNPNENE
jgi:hypothetical protein